MPLTVLVIDRVAPVDARQGNSLIAIEVMRRLAHHRLVLVAPAPSENESLANVHEVFDEVHLVPRSTWTPAIMGSLEPIAMRRMARLPAMDLPAARRLAGTIRRVAAVRRFDVVHARQLPMARYAHLVDGSGKLLELIDSETLGAERARPRTLRTRVRSVIAGSIERRAMHGFDIVTAVAEADARRLAALDRERRIEVVPNGVDVDHFRSAANSTAEATLVFVGAMSYGPNIAAMRWFCTSVLPSIRAAWPDVRLQIVGRDPASAVQALADPDRVIVTGEVDDVRPYLERATVFVAPMVSGSGIKNKVLEAMAMGLPVVATPLGVEGLTARDGSEIVVARDATNVAGEVVRLLRDAQLRRRLGTAARAAVERQYSWDACAARYEQLWTELAAVRRP